MTDPSSWSVLIVDDEPDNLGVIELVLDFHHVAARTARSGALCLKRLEEAVPTLLIIDIQMPEMSGFELLDKIRENAAWRDIPAVAITAHTMSGDAEKILEAGFDGYIGKPIDVMSLIDDLRVILDSTER